MVNLRVYLKKGNKMADEMESIVAVIMRQIDRDSEPRKMSKEAAVEFLEFIRGEIEIRLEALNEEIESEVDE